MLSHRSGIWSLLAIVTLASGCTGASGRVAVKGDPFLDRVSPTARAEAQSEEAGQQGGFNPSPEPAVRPAAAVALAPRLAPLTPAIPVSNPSYPSNEHPAPAAMPAPSKAATYDHDPDYSRLRGRIDRPYSGGVKLRFCDHSHEDQLGGCVFLASNPELKGLREGAWIEVRGRLATRPADQDRDTIYSYPTYEVQGLSILRR